MSYVGLMIKTTEKMLGVSLLILAQLAEVCNFSLKNKAVCNC